MAYALIVEDDGAIVNVLASMMDLLQWKTKIAANPRVAIAQINKELPSLILLDLYMPIASGLEVCDFVRRDPRMQNIPIVMISADGAEHTRTTALEAGVNEYLVKPIMFDDLEAAIMRVGV
jgi:DNA-binding response OmpR family regulator